MDISKEALQLLLATGQQAQAPQVLEGIDDPRTQHFALAGQTVAFDVPPPLRRAQVYSLADLIEVAHSPIASRPVMWHGDSAVVLVLDDDDRRDRVTLLLTHPRPWQILAGLEQEPRWLDQRSFVKLLRFELGVPAGTVAPFRRMEWSTTKAAQGEVQPGRDRLGRQINAEVAGAGELPEELVISTSIYDQLGERSPASVRVAIDIDTAGERLSLSPLPGEIQAAIDDHQMGIQDRLKAELGVPACPVYYGTP